MNITRNQKMLLGATKSFTIPSLTCTEIKIPNNYKKIELIITSDNIFKTIITDEVIQNCNNDILENCCHQNSTFCIEDLNPIENSFNFHYCIDSTYIYACNNKNEETQISIATKIVSTEGCHITQYVDETECANLGLEACKQESTCLSTCQYVECHSYEDELLFGMCLPSNLTLFEINQKCENHYQFRVEGKIGKVLIQKCEGNNEKNDSNESSFAHKIIKYFFILIGMFLLLTFMASIYYRFKTSMDDKRPPFTPPSFCPNFIFPRASLNPLVLVK